MADEIRMATPEAKKPSVINPVLGLVLALSLAGMAFFAAPLILDLLLENVAQFEEATVEFEDDEMDLLTVGIGVMLWFLTFGILLTLVAAVAGKRTIVEQEQATLHPRMEKMTVREAKKYEEKISQQRKKKIEELKKLKAREESQRKRGGS